ncbi:PR domain zinc finger protein 16-like [Acanthaster planci]|uniref:PR domain zinc finger protein 16-like n=1 Tax=Acanthaster planci TaxID=133434 RepID=A0A8B7YNU1_ACAPL|nr:PR domain zinc finger protein 16-like [Acanthaster planci]
MDAANTRSLRGAGSSQRQKCEECEKDFSSLTSLRRHVQEQHTRKEKLNCPRCSKTFIRKHDMEKHLRKAHGGALEMLANVLENLKEELDQPDPVEPPVVSPKRKRVSFASMPYSDPETAEVPSGMTLDSSPSMSCQEVAVQTSPHGGSGETEIIRQRIIERTTKELLDDDGKVVARVITERFLVE